MYTVYVLEGAIWKVGSLFVACKGQKSNYGTLNSSKKQTKLTILSREDAQDSEFRSFLGKIEKTINCFRDLLTFRYTL